MRFHDVINGLFFILLGSAVVITALQFPQMPGQSIGPSTFPVVIGSGMIIGGTIIFISEIVRKVHKKLVCLDSGWREPIHLAAVLYCLLGTFLFGVIFEKVGFPIGAAVLCLGLLLLSGYKKPQMLIMALGFVCAVTVIMTKFLYVPLPMGVFK